MHDPGAVLGGDEVTAQHHKSVGRVGEIRERRQIPHSEQLLTGVAADDLRLLPQFPRVGAQPGTGQHVATARSLCRGGDHDVLDLGVDRDGLVGRQRPRSRRPHHKVGAVQSWIVCSGSCCRNPESDGDGRILPALVDVVVHPQLVAGQRCLVVPAVRQHPDAFVGQALVPQLFERPDDRLHVRQVQGLVVVVEVHPAGLTGDVGAPFAGVLEHRVATGVVERLDAHLLDLRLVGDAELALDFQFGGQAVGVPAEAPLDLVAAHGAVARHDVLDIAGEQVAVVRQAVGERRPVIEHVFRRVVAALNAGAEGVIGRPVVQDLDFEGGKVR